MAVDKKPGERLFWVTISGNHEADETSERYLALGSDPEKIGRDAIIRRKSSESYGPEDAFFIGIIGTDAGEEFDGYEWCLDVYPDVCEKESRRESELDEVLPWEVY